ncbi:MAG: 4-hydroxy-tetrahydrodipicolinate synthase [Alphaproteobacteria bacterium]|nr:4-hydroxy-tetrahydrodipicolinate synthase [Alphaproteobacteria bacterium]
MIELPKRFLRGSYPPIITPFRDGAVDYDAYKKLVEFQLAGGSHGILVTGTTAEPSSLSVPERKKLLEIALGIAKGKVPVVAATGSQNHAETVELTMHADKAGADALLIVTPYYIRPPQRGLVEYYADLGTRTKLPMMIYHIPGRAAVNVTVDTVAAIKERVPHLVGIKHAVNDLEFVTHCLARFGLEFRMFVGLEDLSYPMLCVGACGLMNAVGNLQPRRLADMCEHVFEERLLPARDLHYALFELNQAVFYDTNPIAIKYMMRRLGIIERNEHRIPMVPATKELEERLDGVLRRAKLLN